MTIARRLFDAQMERAGLEDRVFGEILDVLGLLTAATEDWPFRDWTFDAYDDSFEIREAKPDFRFTPEQVDKFLEMGFERMWINHTDGWETYYTRECREGFRKPKDKDAAQVRIGT